MGTKQLPAPALYKQLIKGNTILGLPFEWVIFTVIAYIWVTFVFFSLKSLLVGAGFTIFMYFLGRFFVRKDSNFIDCWVVRAKHRKIIGNKKDKTYHP